jgi:hypothetical protein
MQYFIFKNIFFSRDFCCCYKVGADPKEEALTKEKVVKRLGFLAKLAVNVYLSKYCVEYDTLMRIFMT